VIVEEKRLLLPLELSLFSSEPPGFGLGLGLGLSLLTLDSFLLKYLRSFWVTGAWPSIPFFGTVVAVVVMGSNGFSKSEA
jgi:hypothetical protein